MYQCGDDLTFLPLPIGSNGKVSRLAHMLGVIFGGIFLRKPGYDTLNLISQTVHDRYLGLICLCVSECTCNGHTDQCEFDEQLYADTGTLIPLPW